MPSTIYSGSKVKTLKDTLNLNGGADVISSTTDPTSAAVNAAAGSLLLNTTSGKLYRKNDAGSTTNWTEVGAGGTGKNYITQGTFDNAATTGWSLASSTLDATSKLPNQASGSWGAAAGTLAISTVGAGSQLAGNYSLSLASSAASTAGNMLVSDALTLDLEAQASIQTFSFFYKIASGSANINLSGTSLNSIGVAIYDVTNGAWIDPAGRYNIVQSSGVGKASGTFQVPANCTSVRLAVYFPNASSGAFQILLDDFVLGPQVVQYGAPVTDWQIYTPVWSSNGATQPVLNNGTILGRYRRIGDSIEAQVYLSMGSTTTFGNGTSFRFSYPTQHPLDSTKVTTSSFQSIGGGAGYDASTNLTYVFDAQVGSGTTTSFVLIADTSNNVAFNFPFTWANGDIITASVVYPAAGLSSSVQMSNDTDTRVVAFSAYKSATSSGLTGTDDIIANIVLNDTHGTYNSTTGVYTIPVSGWFRFSGSTRSGSGANGQTNINIVVTGVNAGTYPLSSTNVTTGLTYAVSWQFPSKYYNAGDTVKAQLVGVNTHDIQGGATLTHIGGERVSGPATIAANETVAASYNSSTTSFPASPSSTVIINPNKVYDTHNAYNTSTGVYKVPVSGKYRLTLFVRSALAQTNTVGSELQLRVFKNAVSQVVIGSNFFQTTSSIFSWVAGTATLALNAGDDLSVNLGSLNGAAAFTGNGNENTFFMIERIGN